MVNYRIIITHKFDDDPVGLQIKLEFIEDFIMTKLADFYWIGKTCGRR